MLAPLRIKEYLKNMSNSKTSVVAAKVRKHVARQVVYSNTTLMGVIRYLKAEGFNEDGCGAEWAFCLSEGLIVPQSGRYVLSGFGAMARGDY